MKFKTKTKELREAVSSVSRVVNPRPSTPAMSGLYVRVIEDFVELIGSDLDITIKSRVPVEVDLDGDCLVNSNKLSEIIRKLPEGEVFFQTLEAILR